MARETRRLKRMYADLSMQADLLKEALGWAISTTRDGRNGGGTARMQHCAGLPVARQGFAKQKPERGAFGVSETCYRYSPQLSDENEQIADLLTGLTDARKTWGFGLCFLHLRNVKGHPWNHKRVYPVG